MKKNPRNSLESASGPPAFAPGRRGRQRGLLTAALAAAGWLLLGAGVADAALVPTEWEHRQSLPVAAPGLVRVEPTAATFDAGGPQQEDWRILDPAGHEIACLLDQPPVPVPRTVSPASFEVKLEPGVTRILVATGTTEALSSITLQTPNPFFLRAAQVEISPDNLNWTTLDRGVPLFREWGAEKLEFSLGSQPAAYVRITVTDNRAPALPFTGASLRLAAGPAPAAVPVGGRLVRRDEFAGETVVTVALDGRHLPLAALALETTEPLFMRRVTVSIREAHGALPGERSVGSGTLYRVALDGSPSRSQLEVPLDFSPPTRELLVHIHNGDSPPLALDGIRLERRPVSLLFRAPVAGNYTLLSGNPQAAPPRYDLAAFAGEMRVAGAATVVPGALEDMPDYHPRESLAAAPLPDVPLTGAPLDARNWPDRRSILLMHAGVQELELDLDALARTRADFADLRVLRAGNQIPYVLEQPSLARSLMLTPVPTPDAKRPAVSVWQLRLPQPGLPLRRLVLTSASSLFQRDFRLFEKLSATDGGNYDNVIATGRWSRTPEPGVPESRIFEIRDRLRTDTLWIEADNGDNPAIALGPVQAVYPVVRLIFKVGETDGFALAYGNPEASAPRYDLDLVAARLLTASRNPAQLAAGAPEVVAANPLARLNGGYVFWGALTLVVVVLLVIVARLLPKPPAA